MKNIAKRAIILMIVMAILFTAACNQASPDNTGVPSATQAPVETAQPTPAPTPEPSPRTVLDNAGQEITVPGTINSIAIISTLPLASVYCMVAGSGEKIVGLTPASKNAAVTSFLVEIAPELADVSTEFAQGETVNVEEIIALSPEVVFYNTNNQGDTEAAALLQAAGIPCVGFSPVMFQGNTIETFNAWATLIGDVMGFEERAEEIVSYGRLVEAMVTERVSTIPENERKSALLLGNYNSSAIVAAGKPFGRYWLAAIGAENVAIDIEQALAPINLEQIYAWDPDVIFLNSFSAFTAEDIINSTAVPGQDWSGLSAVQNGQVYKMPLGVYYWFPPCSDSPLSLQWLAKNLYPELFEDIDIDQTIKDYYLDFYGITLTDEQLDTLYNPPAESAMAT